MQAGIVIIGAGHGGVQLAASLREAKYNGPITLISAEADIPYHKPPLSKSFMQTTDTPLQLLRGADFFADKAIDLRLGRRVNYIDRDKQTVWLDNNTSVEYAHLVLATGMRPRPLNIPGATLEQVYYLRTAADAHQLRSGLPDSGHAVIIGGGFIGLEAAAMLAARGLQVTVIEVAERLLARAVSPTTATAVADYLQDSGVQIHCGSAVTALHGKAGQLTHAELNTGEQLEADIVIAGIGGLPEDQLARDAGLETDNGIMVDQYLTTSDPMISALGDCVSFPHSSDQRLLRLESVQNATDQARALALTLNGQATPYDTLPWFWSDMGRLKLQISGLAEAVDEDIIVRRDDGTLQSVWRLQNGNPVAVETLNSPGEHMLSRRLMAEGIILDKALMAAGDVSLLKAAYRKLRT
ncbi:MAG: NAD(P)/FAD-dependent oxidoreductase [Thiolinea sp.]